MAKNNLKEIKGTFIYQDQKGRTVYYDIFTHNGYIIPKSNYVSYAKYQVNTPLAIIVLVILITYTENILLALAVASLIWIGIYALFRFNFLKKLQVIKDFKCPEKNGLTTYTSSFSKGRLVFLALILIVLAITSILNIKNSNFTGNVLFMNYVITAVAGLGALFFLYSALTKK